MNSESARNVNHIVSIIIGLGLASLHQTSLAGTIQGIHAPLEVYTGDPVVVTVTGTGTCANGIIVDYGDGSSAENAGDLPLVFPPKTYAQPGPHTIVAAKTPNTLGCNGSSSRDIKIRAPGEALTQLCAVLDCADPLTEGLTPVEPMTVKGFTPVIDTVFTTPELWTLTPGGELMLKGKHFGAAAGGVFLKLPPPYQSDVPMPVLSWNTTDIKVRVPEFISGVTDHNAAFYVQTGDGTASGLQTMNFKAARETKWLKAGDPGVQVAVCSHGANHNLCNDHHHSDSDCFGPGQKHKDTATFTVLHQNCDSILDWDEGNDVFTVTLKNGYEIVDIDMFYTLSSISEYLDIPSEASLDADAGATSWAKMIHWEVSPGMDYVQYGFFFQVSGPRGVLHF